MNELGEMTDSERAANEAAEFLPASLDTADSGVFSIYEPYACVPVRVNVGPETVFEARP